MLDFRTCLGPSRDCYLDSPSCPCVTRHTMCAQNISALNTPASVSPKVHGTLPLGLVSFGEQSSCVVSYQYRCILSRIGVKYITPAHFVR